MPSRQLGLTPAQVAERQNGIGGSDAAAVLGANPWKTAAQLYLEKVGKAEPSPLTPATKRGIYLEPVAVELYQTLTGRRLRRINRTLRSPDFPWMLAHIDREIVGAKGLSDELVLQGAGINEVKCPGIRVFAKVKREALPLYWTVQMQHYFAVTGRKWGSFAVFNSDLWEMIHFDVVRDDAFIAKLVEAERVFWFDHVIPHVPPGEPTVEFKFELPEVDGQLVLRSDPDWQEAARNYREVLELKESTEALVETGKVKLKELMGGYGATEGAGIRCYFNQQAGRTTFDKKALVRAKPLDRALLALKLHGVVQNEILEEILTDCELDLASFEKQGDPFETFRTYPVTLAKVPED